MPFVRGNGAITLGNVILYGTGPNEPVPEGTIGMHEEQHTYQAEMLGPFHLPAHLVCGLWSELTTNDWHNNNFLEIGPEDVNGPHPWPTWSQLWERFTAIPDWIESHSPNMGPSPTSPGPI